MSDKRSVSTDALETLGSIIGPDEKRDAIHIAVEPVIAGHHLAPGADVGRMPDGTYSTAADHLVGIVDPFIQGRVNKGERFWLLIYPRQIKSLRHVWSHPDFDDEPEAVAPPPPVPVAPGKHWAEKGQAFAARIAEEDLPVTTLHRSVEEPALAGVVWIEDFARRIGQSYEDLMEAADRWVSGEHYTYDNSEQYKDHWEEFPEFWDHWSLVTGRDKPSDASSFFTCSC